MIDDTHQKALDYFAEDKIKAALPLFEEALEKDRDNNDILFKLGICLFRLKRYETAQSTFLALTSRDADHYEAWYYLGLTFERQDQIEEATKAYRFALAVNPDFSAAKQKLSTTKTEASSRPKQTDDAELNVSPGEVVYRADYRRKSSFGLYWTLIIVVTIASLALIPVTDSGSILFMILLVPIIIGLVLHSRTTKYVIYERRIDRYKGIFFREHTQYWLYGIKNLTFKRNPWDLLTRNAKIYIETEIGNFSMLGLPPPENARKMSSQEFVKELFDELRNSVRGERGRVKGIWV